MFFTWNVLGLVIFFWLRARCRHRNPIPNPIDPTNIYSPLRFEDFLLAMHALVDYEHDGFQDQWQAELREELGESRRGRMDRAKLLVGLSKAVPQKKLPKDNPPPLKGDICVFWG